MLNHWEVAPGQAVELHCGKRAQRFARFRYRTVDRAYFEVGGELVWFRLAENGRLLTPQNHSWAIHGELDVGPHRQAPRRWAKPSELIDLPGEEWYA
jgi:hypothetical protein